MRVEGTVRQRTGNTLYAKMFSWIFYGMLSTAFSAVAMELNSSLMSSLAGSLSILVGDAVALGLLSFIIIGSIAFVTDQMARYFFFGYSVLLGFTIALAAEVLFGAKLSYLLFAIAGGIGAVRLLLFVESEQIPRQFLVTTYALITTLLSSFITFMWYNDIFYWIATVLLVAYSTLVLAFDLGQIKGALRIVTANKVSLVGAMVLNADMVNAAIRWMGKPLLKGRLKILFY